MPAPSTRWKPARKAFPASAAGTCVTSPAAHCARPGAVGLVDLESPRYSFGTTAQAMVADEHTLRSHLFEQLAEPFSAQELFDCLPDVVFFIKNAQCQYVVVNHTLVERCGRPSKAHLLGRRADEVFPAPLGESYRTQDEEVIRAGSAIRDRLELHFYPTGRCGWCLTNKLPLRGSSGQTVGLVGVSKDLQTANEKGQDYARIADAVTRIRNGYDQPLQVSELAAAAGLSVYQFEQRIRRIFHMTAGHLI